MVKKTEVSPRETLKSVDSLSFEEAVQELESMVSKLESADLPLADSLDAYQRGSALLKHAQGILSHVQTEIEVIEAQSSRTMDRSSLVSSTKANDSSRQSD